MARVIFSKRQEHARARSWLEELGLCIPPWMHEEELTIGIDHAVDSHLPSSTHRQAVTIVEPWVVACYRAALEMGSVRIFDGVEPRAIPIDHKRLVRWNNFLLLAAKDEALWRAIDGVARLGSAEACVAYVRAAYRALHVKLANAPRLLIIEERQVSRARRLDGRAGRPCDRDWVAEGLPPIKVPRTRKPRLRDV